MSTQSEAQLDFGDLITKMKTARQAVEEQRPAILGGRFGHSQLRAFLGEWRTYEMWKQMPWRIWEHVSTIGFAEEPEAPDLLQRAEIFGEGGHLTLRRDGDRWLWYFIGVSKPDVPAEFSPSSFWNKLTDNKPANSKTSDTVLYRYAESVILWGEEVRKDEDDPEADIGTWRDDRVGAALLKYPQMQGNDRVYLHYWRYTEAGQTAFVWYRGLGNAQEVKTWPK